MLFDTLAEITRARVDHQPHLRAALGITLPVERCRLLQFDEVIAAGISVSVAIMPQPISTPTAAGITALSVAITPPKSTAPKNSPRKTKNNEIPIERPSSPILTAARHTKGSYPEKYFISRMSSDQLETAVNVFWLPALDLKRFVKHEQIVPQTTFSNQSPKCWRA